MIVLQDRCAHGDHRLGAIRHWQLSRPAARLPARFERINDRFVEQHAAPEQRGDRRLGEIIGRWAESAAGDHCAGAFKRFSDSRRDLVGAIAHGRAAHHADPQRSGLACEEGGVGVDRVAEQQLVANGDEFDVHARQARLGMAKTLPCFTR